MARTAAPLDDRQRQLVEGCIGFAYSMASRFARRRRNVDLDEAISNAFFRLVNAARTYRPELGFQFTTHAGESMRWLADRQRPLPLARFDAEEGFEPATVDHAASQVPFEARDECERLRQVIPAKALALLWRHHVDGQSIEDMADEMNLSRERVRLRLAFALEEARKAVGVR